MENSKIAQFMIKKNEMLKWIVEAAFKPLQQKKDLNESLKKSTRET